ncbi:hypothetical protein [Massilia alkalitolerans]|uniref:hypothetical protein n=2 Tax=Massilia TaxID=149698 RepID=UPI00055AA77B|nr:hypothetical protein [Massilia alkalitolerans]
MLQHLTGMRMHWNDWPIVCWTLSTLLCLAGRRWTDAFCSACFAVYTSLDRMPPAAAPAQLKWAFALAGAAVVVVQVMKEYRRYRNSLAVR